MQYKGSIWCLGENKWVRKERKRVFNHKDKRDKNNQEIDWENGKVKNICKPPGGK